MAAGLALKQHAGSRDALHLPWLYLRSGPLPLCAAACKFDLRFVPDEQSFKGRQVRDEAGDVPSGVTPHTVLTLDGMLHRL